MGKAQRSQWPTFKVMYDLDLDIWPQKANTRLDSTYLITYRLVTLPSLSQYAKCLKVTMTFLKVRFDLDLDLWPQRPLLHWLQHSAYQITYRLKLLLGLSEHVKCPKVTMTYFQGQIWPWPRSLTSEVTAPLDSAYLITYRLVTLPSCSRHGKCSKVTMTYIEGQEWPWPWPLSLKAISQMDSAYPITYRLAKVPDSPYFQNFAGQMAYFHTQPIFKVKVKVKVTIPWKYVQGLDISAV